MELISNLSFIEAAAKELIGPKPCPYSNLDLCNNLLTQGNKYPLTDVLSAKPLR